MTDTFGKPADEVKNEAINPDGNEKPDEVVDMDEASKEVVEGSEEVSDESDDDSDDDTDIADDESVENETEELPVEDKKE